MSADPAMLSYYTQRAREFDRVYEKPERQEDLAVLRARVAALLGGRRVFEVACGTAWWTQHYAPVAREVFATDLSDEMLDLARSRGLPYPRVRFARGDAFALPVPPHPCEAGFAAFWWSHLRRDGELAAFLAHFLERLEPGARFLFIDNRFVEGSSTPISRVDDRGNSYQVRQLENGATHEVLKNFPTREEVEYLLSDLAREAIWEPVRHYWMVWGEKR